MKKIFVLSVLIFAGMICSCQKQNSGAEQRLAQREAALDARERALDAREKALHESQRALDERQKAIANISAISPDLQGRTSDPAQAKAEREKRIQQLPAEIRALVPDPAQVNSIKFEKKTEAAQTGPRGQSSDAAKAEREKRIEQLPPEIRALIPDPAKANKFEKKGDKPAIMSGAGAFPGTSATSPIPSPAVEDASPSP